MATETEILILCTEKDNEPISEGELGWVTNFQRFLELMLFQVLGEKPKTKLKTENDISASEVKNAGMLVAILSPDYLSDQNILGMTEDYAASNDDKQNNLQRFFKVLKAPVNIEDQPVNMRGQLGYELYYIDEESGDLQEITDFFHADAEKNYWMKLVDLAYDIHESFIQLKEISAKKDVKPLFSRKSVYLAETSHDLTIQRNIIRRELQRYGYRVLPDHTLPNDAEELEKIVKKELDECNVSIHLIGSTYGDVPKGADRSVVDLQNKIASDITSNGEKDASLSRLIWISPDMKNTSEKQKTFIENIKRDIATLEGAEILQTPLEDFKNIIREELIEVSEEKKYKIKKEDTAGKSSKRKVYLVYDKIDQKEVAPLKKFIEKSNYEVVEPDFDGELLDLREKHLSNLRDFDMAIIFAGKVNLQWVRMKLLDLLKAPGFGRDKPILGRAIVTGEGVEIDPKNFDMHDVKLIDGGKKLPLDDIKNFLEIKL